MCVASRDRCCCREISRARFFQVINFLEDSENSRVKCWRAMAVIKSIVARQIFDSRGNPTVEVKKFSFSVAFLRIPLCDLRSVKAFYFYFFSELVKYDFLYAWIGTEVRRMLIIVNRPMFIWAMAHSTEQLYLVALRLVRFLSPFCSWPDMCSWIPPFWDYHISGGIWAVRCIVSDAAFCGFLFPPF